MFINLLLPKSLKRFIFDNKGELSVAHYIIKCLYYIRNNAITLDVIYESEKRNANRTKDPNRRTENADNDTM